MHIWILQKSSSLMLFYYSSHVSENLDQGILSGLLGALNTLSEMELKDQGIESIDMGGLRWVYLSDPAANLLLVGADGKDSNAKLMLARLKVINKMFVQTFEISSEFWTRVKVVELSHFRSFKETIQMLESQWVEAEKVMDVGIIFDLLGVFQNVFIRMINIVEKNLQGDVLNQALMELSLLSPKIIKYMQDQGKPESKRIIELFIPKVDFGSQKIIFNEAQINNVFGLNPIGLDFSTLKPLFFTVLHDFRATLDHSIGEKKVLEIVKKEIMPFLFSKWDFLQKLDVVKEFFHIFLS